MLSKFIRHFLFNLIHLLLSLLVTVKDVYRRFWLAKSIDSKREVTKSDIQNILHYVPRLKKKVHHLMLQTDTRLHSFEDLALVVIWSLLSGVSYVSFYDVTGELHQQEEKLFIEVEKRKKGIPGCIKWSKMPNLNGYTNGAQANTVVINIFTNNDGRAKIAQCIKYMAENKLSYNCTSNEMTAQEFDEVLSTVYPSIPEPEIVLYTGHSCCSHGVLPWHIRLSEFVQLSVDNSFTIKDYLGALSKYSKCDQRFGK